MTETATSTTGLKPVRVPSVSDVAYESIRDSILGGRLAMGSRLVDVRLADELQVSRGIVREALARLADEGLVIDRPRQGTFVREFGPRDIIDLFNIRVALEPLAARLIIRRRASTDGLREIVRRLEAMRGTADNAAYTAVISDFHTELVRQSGNAHLVDMFRSIQSRLRMALSVEWATVVHSATGIHHSDVIEALESGDEHRAATTVHSHIMEGIGDLLARLGADPSELVPAR